MQPDYSKSSSIFPVFNKGPTSGNLAAFVAIPWAGVRDNDSCMNKVSNPAGLYEGALQPA